MICTNRKRGGPHFPPAERVVGIQGLVGHLGVLTGARIKVLVPGQGPSVRRPRRCRAPRVPALAPPGSSSGAGGRSCSGGQDGGPADGTAASGSCHFPSWDLFLWHSPAVTWLVTDSWWSVRSHGLSGPGLQEAQPGAALVVVRASVPVLKRSVPGWGVGRTL